MSSRIFLRHRFLATGLLAATGVGALDVAMLGPPGQRASLTLNDPRVIPVQLLLLALLLVFGWFADRSRVRLERERRRLGALIDSNPDMVVRLTADGLYLDVHVPDALREMIDPEQYLGRYVDEIFEPEFAIEHAERRRRALATAETQCWEYVRPAGETQRHLEARFVACGPNEVIVTVRDISERVKLEREVVTSAENERSRVGRDLHDSLAQQLAGTKLILESLTRSLFDAGSPLGADAERAVDQVGIAIGQTRDLARGLSPIPPGATLIDALRIIARDTSRLLAVECRLEVSEGIRRMPESLEIHLYRIAQEAIANAIKHGRTRRVTISLARDRARRRLVMTIASDGVDFPQRKTSAIGMGLRTMRYRAQSIGGELTVRRGPRGGTVVKCWCPLPKAEPDPDPSAPAE